MQKQHLKLREIVWEITGRCDNKCSYCGSKELWKEEIDESKIKSIADAIVCYPPEEINISGGDPILVPWNIHQYVVGVLHNAGVKVKLIVNPKSLSKLDSQQVRMFLNLYDHTGISINSLEDISIFRKLLEDNDLSVLYHTTLITNFNTQNIWAFNSIYDLIKQYSTIAGWQIQYTVYRNSDDERAIYNNDEALNYLAKQINDAKSSKIIISDNANEFPCHAGIATLGITSNGSVVPCLSMRSWAEICDTYQGFLVGQGSESLREIWEKYFKEYRFGEFKCCKDHCKNKCLKMVPHPDEIYIVPNTNPSDRTLVYGVQIRPEPIVMYYGVFEPRYPVNPKDYIVMAYAVSTGTDSTKWEYNATVVGSSTTIPKKDET